MANKSGKRCTVSLATRETQNNTTILPHKLKTFVLDILELITQVGDDVKKCDPS